MHIAASQEEAFNSEEISQWIPHGIPLMMSCIPFIVESRAVEMRQSLANTILISVFIQKIWFNHLDIKISEDSQKFFLTLRKLKPSVAASK